MKKIEAEPGTTWNGLYIRTIFRLAKPAFFRYNENFTLGRDFYVTSRLNVKILIVPEEGWFGQLKYSTYIKTILRCAGFCLYFLQKYTDLRSGLKTLYPNHKVDRVYIVLVFF